MIFSPALEFNPAVRAAMERHLGHSNEILPGVWC